MVQWNQGKHLIHFLFAVVSIHVFCGYFEFLPQIVFDDPIASYRQQTYGLCNFAEQIVINHNCALLYLLSLDFWSFYFFFSLNSSSWMLISENIIFLFLTLLAWLICTFAIWLFIEIFFEHVIIFSYLSCNFFFIIIYFSHETEINKSIDLSLLVLRPNILSWFLLILVLIWFWFRCFRVWLFILLVYLLAFRFVIFSWRLSFNVLLLFLASFLSVVVFKKTFFVRFQVFSLFYMPVS